MFWRFIQIAELKNEYYSSQGKGTYSETFLCLLLAATNDRSFVIYLLAATNDHSFVL